MRPLITLPLVFADYFVVAMVEILRNTSDIFLSHVFTVFRMIAFKIPLNPIPEIILTFVDYFH